MTKVKYGLWILISAAFWSCSGEQPKEQDPVELFSSLGFSLSHDKYLEAIGAGREEIIQKFKLSADSVNNHSSLHKRNIPFSDSSYYHLEFRFTEGMVSTIDMDLYPADSLTLFYLVEEFGSYFNQRFGEGSTDGDYAVWYSQNNEGQEVEISFLNESENYGKPYLAVIYFQEEGIAD